MSIKKVFSEVGIKKIAHVAIAVKSLEKSSEFFFTLLGETLAGEELIPERGIKVGFFRVGESHIELIEPQGENSTIQRFIQKRGEGLHHIAFEVENIREVLDYLKERQVRLIDEEPQKGAHESLIAFIHPEATSGVLIELVQKGEK